MPKQSMPEAIAATDAAITVSCQLEPPINAIRCGVAEPRASAPTRKRRSLIPHPTIIFIPTGYTPARKIPVAMRARIAKSEPGSRKIRLALTKPAQTAYAAKTKRGSKRSGIPSTARNSAPITTPACTPLESAAERKGVKAADCVSYPAKWPPTRTINSWPRLQRQAGKGLIVTSYGWRRRGRTKICAIVHLITRWRATGEQKFANHRDSASPIGCDTRQAPKYVDDL